MTVEALPTQSVPAHIEMILDEIPCPLCASERRHTAADGLINFLNRADARRYSFSECDECGLAYLNPRPRNLDAVYPDDYAKHQANALKGNAFRDWSRRLLHRLFLDYP